MSSRTVAGVAIRAYGPTGDDARHLLDEAARALPRLVARLGAYPYAALTIARVTGGGASWLESLRRKVVVATYWQAMRTYLADHRDGFGGTRALLKAVDTGSPLDLRNGYRLRFPRWF